MRISGTGIAVAQQVKVLKGYKPDTRLALTWNQAADGTWVATDRGYLSDIYETVVSVYGRLADINNLVDALEGNKTADNHILSLDWFWDDEHIFGADVDHSGAINATCVDFGTIVQGSWGGYGVSLRLRALSPSLTGTSTLPSLQYLDIGFEADSANGVNKYDTYRGTYTYANRGTDAGRFEGMLKFSDTNMQNMRTYLRSTRGASFSVSGINGVKYPWGPRRGSTWPVTVRCTDWSDLGMWGEQFWVMRVVFNEVRS